MRSSLRLITTCVVTLILGVTGTGGIAAAQAALFEHQTAIDATTGNYAVIAPTFTGTSATNTPQSFIRLFSGGGNGGNTSNFIVRVLGTPSGQVYGSSSSIPIPPYAMVQYSIQEILSIVGAGSLSGGDTGYVVYLQNTDQLSGYQHDAYNWGDGLFENVGSCNAVMNEQMLSRQNSLVLTGVQTSKQTYPSTIVIHNFSSQPTTYKLTVYNAGMLRTSTGGISSNAGKQTCQFTQSVPANASLSIPESTIESTPGCTIDSDEGYMNITIANNNSTVAPSATISHLVHIATTSINGDTNLTDVCAVNKVVSSSSTGGTNTGGTTGTGGGGTGGTNTGGTNTGGSSGNSQKFIANGTTGTVYTLTAPQNIAGYTVATASQTAQGVSVTGSLQTNPSGSITQTAAGFNLTLPDGKIVNFTMGDGASDLAGTNEFETLSTDGTRDIDISLTSTSATTLSSSTYGDWVEQDTSSTPLSLGAFATGIASASIPTTGTATYSGNISGYIASATNAGEIKSGTVSLTANFATGTFTGTVTNVVSKYAGDNSPSGTANSMTFTGTIGSGNSFSGSVAPSSTGGTQFNYAAASGTFAGKFWGTSGAEAGGTLTLSGGGITLIGAFGAHQ